MKKQSKRLLAVLLSVLLLLGTAATGLSAAAEGETSHIVAEGDCGWNAAASIIDSNLHWTLSSKGTVVVSGSGEMIPMFSFHPIWDDCIDPETTGQPPVPVKIVVIEPGATNISHCAFSYAVDMTTIVIPSSVTSIGTYAFEACDALKSVFYTGTEEQWAQIENVEEIEAFENVTIRCNIVEWGFLGRTYFISTNYYSDGSNIIWTQDVDGQVVVSGAGEMASGNMNTPAMRTSRTITSAVVEADIETLPYCAFSGAMNMTSAVLPEGLKLIDGYAFEHCHSLESITIPASVTKIASRAFSGSAPVDDVYYGGSREQWAQIDMDAEAEYNYNKNITEAHIHFADETDDITWTLEDGVLTISGTGAIWPTVEKVESNSEYWNSETQTWQTSSGFYYTLHYPWEPDEATIKELLGGIPLDVFGRVVKKIVVEEGITEINGSAFQYFMPETVVLPSTLRRVAAHRDAASSSALFEPFFLKDLYIGNPDAVFRPDNNRFSGDGYFIQLSGSTQGNFFESFDALRNFYASYYDNYLEFIQPPGFIYWGEGLYALQTIFEARHHAVISMNSGYYVNDDALDTFISGRLRHYADSWELAGIRYDTYEHFEADLIAKLNELFGSSFSSVEDLFVLKPAETEGERPTVEYSEALMEASLHLWEALKEMEETTYEMEGTLEHYALGGEPIAKIQTGWNQETQTMDYDYLPLTAYPWLTIHGYADSTAEAAAAASGVRFVPITAAGTCGEHLTWVLENNTLTVSGTGAMTDYSESEPAPWAEYFAAPDAEITVLLEAGVTQIGANAFPASDGLKELIILNRDCDLSALVIREPAFLRGYLGSSAMTYANEHDLMSVFKPLCDVDYRHTVEIIEGVDSTCKEPGHTPGLYCVECDNAFYGNETLPLENHTWGAWVTTKEATTETEGIRTRTCAVCDAKETQTIEKLTPTDNGGSDSNDDNNDKGGFFGWLQQAMKGLVAWFKKLLQFFSK